MSRMLVQAVLFARYTRSNYKALYGRLPGKTTYTQDYVQLRDEVAGTLKPLLSPVGDNSEVTYSWPGGNQVGHFTWSSDRNHLKWDTNKPPPPWTLGDVDNDPVVSLPGDRSKRNEADADAQEQAIANAGWTPWLLAIKLFGQANLHLRVYFDTPPAKRADRGTSQLPKKLREAMRTLPANAATGIVDWSGDIMPAPEIRAKKLVKEILDALGRDPNVLLVGPPGTGKSVALEDLRSLYSQRASTNTPTFDPDSWPGDWGTAGIEARSESLVFHPSYSYENFVAGLFPKSEKGVIELEAKAGPLLCLSHWIGDTDKRALLILDEFNRGPAAAIFGDTLGLLDKDKRSGPGRPGVHIQQPYPQQQMPVPESYRRVATDDKEQVEKEVRLPAGVHIVAAMNSTDRSVAPLDAAMRRRFTVIRVRPDYDALAEHLGLDLAVARTDLPAEPDPAKWTVDQMTSLAVKVLEKLNERIEYCLGEDFLLGHALVWGLKQATAVDTLAQLAHAIDAKVVPTLRMTFIDQDEVLAPILGVPDSQQVSHADKAPTGSVAYWRTAPAALSAIAPKRLMVLTLHAMPSEQQLAAIVALTRN